MLNRLAVISDIHANKEALERVLADVANQGIQQIICLGDIVGYASSVRSTLKIIRDFGCPTVLGNHDEAAINGSPPADFNEAAKAGVDFAAARLKPQDVEWLRSLPLSLEIGGVTFAHASLANPGAWHYVLNNEDARVHFRSQSTPLAFCGHSHRPGIWWQEPRTKRIGCCPGVGTRSIPQHGKVLVDVGSVGQPRDSDPHACYAIYDTTAQTIEFRRIAYDVERVQKNIRRAKLPKFTAQRLALGR
jgi:diadenosine tetraphosphatase ApaH/serine/threonine PP2A family protein phosphatase